MIRKPKRQRKSAAQVMLEAETEKHFQAWVVELARVYGWLTYHTWRSDNSQPGFPDIVAIRRSRMIVLELKTEQGKVTPAQDAWLDAFAEVPFVRAGVFRPSERQALEAMFK